MTELNCDNETSFDLDLFPTIRLATYFRKESVFEKLFHSDSD